MLTLIVVILGILVFVGVASLVTMVFGAIIALWPLVLGIAALLVLDVLLIKAIKKSFGKKKKD